MPETVTLTIPDRVLGPLQRVAQATHQWVEELLLSSLEASLPPLEGLPGNIIENLTTLETLDDLTLCQVIRETVPAEEQQELGRLLERSQTNSLTQAERQHLASLQQRADLVMLRKARAAVLLRFRGKRTPALSHIA
jgi:hypothetical protein